MVLRHQLNLKSMLLLKQHHEKKFYLELMIIYNTFDIMRKVILIDTLMINSNVSRNVIYFARKLLYDQPKI